MKQEEREADRIRGQVAIEALVRETVPLVRCGSRLIGPCPFCTDDDGESLEVVEAEGTFGCSLCGREGDCFRWLMMIDALTFREALQVCAEGVAQYRRVA